MSNPETTEFELGYAEGQRRLYVQMLAEALRGLGHESPEGSQHLWLLEREEAVATCRRICQEHGDNDWPDELHLSDIIEPNCILDKENPF